jgi:hypothetical protein
VFNPQHIGGVRSTFCWSSVDGCADPATAIRRAGAFASAVSQKGVEDGTFWSAKASDYLRGYFHAAALAQYDLRAVAAWVSGADPDVPERILAAAGARHWALTLAELRSEAHKTAATVRMPCPGPSPSWPTPPRLARALGVRETAISELVRGDARTVSPELRDKVTALYDAWWDKRAAERTPFGRGAATLARRRAIAGNWCAAAALDDDQLDVTFKPPEPIGAPRIPDPIADREIELE